jgi:hypothetical protein
LVRSFVARISVVDLAFEERRVVHLVGVEDRHGVAGADNSGTEVDFDGYEVTRGCVEHAAKRL